MPLHLLGKKSWNVYNPENIAKVRRDEAAAQAQEEQQERRWREEDAGRRLETLRGRSPPSAKREEPHEDRHSVRPTEKSRKRRRLAGEDDTQRDIRWATEDAKISKDASLFDSDGHLDLVPDRPASRKADLVEKTQNEVGGMRFRDAAGARGDCGKPWYTKPDAAVTGDHVPPSRDVWGNEDPRRRDREQQRMTTNDPLLAMKKGVKQLRDNERQRQEWKQQREKDMNEVERLAKRQRRRQETRKCEEDGLDGFDLDQGYKIGTPKDSSGRSSRHGERSRHRRHRSRSPTDRHAHHRHYHRHRVHDRD